MFCPHCAEVNSKEATVCVSCGEPLAAEAPMPAQESPAEQPAASQAEGVQPAAKNRAKIPWYVFALGGLALVVGLVVVGVVAYLLLGNKSGSIAYAVWEGSEVERGVYLMDGDGQNARLLVPLEADQGDVVYLDWSPDGSQIAYGIMSNGSWEYELWVVEVKSGATTRLVDEIEGGDFSLFDWSPDSRQIVYTASEDELWIVSADGSQDTKLTPGSFPFWSPDGDFISYVDWQENAAGLIRPDGSEQTTLGDNTDNVFIPWGWSPDGKWILTHIQESVQGGINIVLLSRDGAEQVDIATSAEMDEALPSFAPNGKWIAYLTYNTNIDNTELYIVRQDGSGTKQIAAGISVQSFISWAPDSNALIYISEEGVVVSVEIDSGEATTLTAEGVPAVFPVYAP